MTVDVSSIRNVAFREVFGEAFPSNRLQLFVTASGYEARATHWLRLCLESRALLKSMPLCVLGFDTYEENAVRKSNDSFYKSLGAEVVTLSAISGETAVAAVNERLNALIDRGQEFDVHVDYSSMPRAWYSALALSLMSRRDDVFTCYFWYTPGAYSTTSFPSAGVKDFKLFSGEPSVAAATRTHVFGLGFDKIRSQAILSVIDPQQYICFYTDPGARPEDSVIVRSENAAMLNGAMEVIVVPLHDFVTTLSRIREACMLYSRWGDVVLVPDGPKPLILAASIVPDSLGIEGVACFHVGRRPDAGATFNVVSHGDPVGFTFGR